MTTPRPLYCELCLFPDPRGELGACSSCGRWACSSCLQLVEFGPQGVKLAGRVGAVTLCTQCRDDVLAQAERTANG